MSTPAYLHGHHRSVLAAHAARTAEDAAAFLFPHIESDMSILDFGCGPGTITAGLAKAVSPDGSVVGIDTSESLASEWEKRIEESQLQNLRFGIGDIYNPDFEPETFDIAYAHQILQHLSDPVAALTNAARVVKTGGLVAVREVDWGTFAIYPEIPAIREFRKVYDEVATLNQGNPKAGRNILQWMNRAANLGDVRISTSTWTFAEPEGREWWADQWSARILTSNIATSALQHGVATRDQLQEIADAWQQWKTIPDAVSAFTHFEGIAKRI